MAGKFENKKTLVKYVTIDMSADVLEKVEGDMVIDYTRSKDLAEKAVKKALSVSDDVLIKITELVNEKTERKEYDPQSVFDFSFERSELFMVTDAEAIETFKKRADDTPNAVAIVIPWYVYRAQVFMADKRDGDVMETNYICEEVYYDSSVKHTAREMRSFIAMEAENQFFGFYTVGMHGERRAEFKQVCLVDRDELPNIKLREIQRRK